MTGNEELKTAPVLLRVENATKGLSGHARALERPRSM